MSAPVLAEHLEYLTLPGRLDRYRAALAQVVTPGCTVADLGCGLGVIGIEALKAGAGRVYGIDQSDALELARETMARAGLADAYLCLRGSTFSTTLPEPVDLLVCDHVGYFGLDYGIIGMLADARQRLLRPGGQIMPRRIRLSVAAVQSSRARAPVDAWIGADMQAEQRWLQAHASNSKHSLKLEAGEICSAPACLGEINLAGDTADYLSFKARLVATRDCTVDGIAGWFDCELAEGIWMTNSPLSAETIGRDNAFFPAQEPVTLRQGEEVGITIGIRHQDHILSWTLSPPNGGKVQKMSTWNSQILEPHDLDAGNDVPLELDQVGLARRLLLQQVDGTRTAQEIEQAFMRDHAALLPTTEAAREFVRRQLRADTRRD